MEQRTRRAPHRYDRGSAWVAANTRRLRTEAGLSLSEVAARMGALEWPMNPSQLSKIETGRRTITVDDLLALAEALQVGPATLLAPVAGLSRNRKV
jgi:transcriptional regulator with XRE-family HTH domain